MHCALGSCPDVRHAQCAYTGAAVFLAFFCCSIRILTQSPCVFHFKRLDRCAFHFKAIPLISRHRGPGHHLKKKNRCLLGETARDNGGQRTGVWSWCESGDEDREDRGGMWGGRSRERPTQTPHRAIRSRPADVTVAVEVAVVTTPHVVTSRRIARARARMT